LLSRVPLSLKVVQGLRVLATSYIHRSIAEDSGLGPEQCKLLGSAYQQKKAKLREILGRIGECLSTLSRLTSIYKLIAQSRLVDDLYPFIPSPESIKMLVYQYDADRGTDE
jgi:hypothetical protein